MKLFFSTLFTFAVMLSVLAEGIVLTADGRAAVSIAAGKSSSEKLAVKELCDYIRKISGAAVSVDTADKAGMIIGMVGDKNIPVAVAKMLDGNIDGDSFVLKTLNGKLYIVGKKQTGALYGTYYFMNKYLGVIFFTPDEEYVPRKTTLKFGDISEKKVPAFIYRVLDQVGSHGLAPKSRTWAARNGIYIPGTCGYGGWFPFEWQKNATAREFVSARADLQKVSLFGSHMAFMLPVPEKKYSKTNPEYFSVTPAGRGRHHCISNPDVQRLTVEYVCKKIEELGAENMIWNFGAPDTQLEWCRCKNCEALDKAPFKFPNVSRRYHLVTQKIAKQILDRHPDANIWTYAYWNYRECPDDIQFDPRVTVYFCPHQRCYAHAINDPECSRNSGFFAMMKKWLKAAPKMVVFEYSNSVPGIRYTPVSDVLLKDLQVYRDLGILGRKEEMYLSDVRYVGTWAKNAAMFAGKHAGEWQHWLVFSRGTWDPDMDYEKFMEDIQSKYYGRIWPVMKEYHKVRKEVWDSTSGCFEGWGEQNDHRTPKLLSAPGVKDNLFALLKKAEKEAQGDKILLRRLATDRRFLEEYWVKLNDKYLKNAGRNIEAPAARKTPVLDGVADGVYGGGCSEFKSGGKPVPAELATSISMAMHGDKMYAVISAGEPDTSKLIAKAGKNVPAEIWNDDIIELFIVPANNANAYYQFVVNPAGRLLEIRQPGNIIGKIGAKVAVKVEKKRWVAEFEIPTGNMEGSFTPGSFLNAHVSRSRNCAGDKAPNRLIQLDGTPNRAFTDFRTVQIGDPLISNGNFEKLDKKGQVDGWSLLKGAHPVVVNGNRMIKLGKDAMLRRIPYGSGSTRLFMPQKPVRIKITFRACGKGIFMLDFPRYIAHGNANNESLGTVRGGQWTATADMRSYQLEYTINANEFIQVMFISRGEICIDDVAISLL